MLLPQGSIMESKAFTRRWNKEELHMVNVKECKMLARRWQSDECMEAMLKFFQRKAKLWLSEKIQKFYLTRNHESVLGEPIFFVVNSKQRKLQNCIHWLILIDPQTLISKGAALELWEHTASLCSFEFSRQFVFRKSLSIINCKFMQNFPVCFIDS